MADEIAGQVVVQILGEASLKQIKKEIETTLKGTVITLPVELKLAPKTVTNVVADAKKQLAAVRYKPDLETGLKLKGTAVNDLVAETRLKFADRVDLPRLPATLTLADKSVAKLITEANTKLAAAKTNLPKIKVDLDLDTEQMELVKELRTRVTAMNVAFTGEIEIPLDLDEKSIARVSEKAAAAMAVIQARIDAEMMNREAIRALRQDELRDKDLVKHEAYLRDRENLLADAARKDDDRLRNRTRNMQGILDEDLGKIQNRLNEATSRGLDARSMAELRFQQRRILANEKAERQIRKSSQSSLRILRNDLSSFDATATRVVRRLGFVFAGFTAGVVASFAAISIASLRSFAETETQIRRTAAVLGTDIFSETIASTNDQTQAFAAFRAEVERTDQALRGTVESVALKTVFDPTEVAAGTRALAQAGLKVDEIKASLLATAQFAQNEELLPEEAVANLVQGATAAGESLAELTQLADQFTFVANNTTATATEVAAAFSNRAAPAFRAYGEEVSATLTVLDLFAAAGIRGKTAGEQAGILIREINKAATKTPATTAAFKKYGIAIGLVNGKQIPFLETLADLGVKLEEIRKTRGSGGLAAFRKELGLTEKSGAGLLQLLPQIAKLGEPGLLRLQKQIERAGGSVARQSEIITDTLGFQFEQFTNQIGALFKIAAGPAGKAFTDILAKFNDQLESGTKSGDALKAKFLEIGQAISDEFVPAVESFFFGGQGNDFFSGVVQMYRGFLGGLRDTFVEFRNAAFGPGDRRGFFTVLGQSLGNLGDFAAAALPRIGRLFGIITKFVNENEALVRSFARFTLAAFVANKALRLFIVPIENIVGRLGFMRKAIVSIISLNFVSTIGTWVAGLVGYTTATTAAAAATNALAVAQARAAATTGTSAAAKAASAAAAGAGGGAAAKAAAGATVGTQAAKSVSRLSAAITLLRENLGKFARATIIIPVVLGMLKGALDQLSESFGGDGNVTMRDFMDTMKAVTKTTLGLIDQILTAAAAVGRLLFWFGKLVGAILAWGVVEIIKAIGKALDDTLGGAIRMIGSFVGWLGQLVGKLGVVKSTVESIKSPFKGLELDLSRQSEGIQNIGKSLTWLADGWEDVGAQNISGMFRDASESITHNNARIDENIKKTMKLNEANRKAHAEQQARLAAAEAKIRVFGITNGLALNATGAWTRGNRALGLTLQEAANRATNFQKRQANMAVVLNVVARRTRNAGLWQKILSEASTDLATNLDRLTGKKDSINGLLNTIATGSDRAAKAARLAGIRMAQLTEAATISEATRGGTAMSGRAIKQIADARAAAQRSIAAFNDEFKARDEGTQTTFDDFATGATDAATAATAATREIKTASEQATEAVNKLTQAQLNRQGAALVGKVMRASASGYKATAMQAEILKRVLPGVEAQLERQQAAVAKLDAALQSLQSTQLKGTKAFSDQTFAIEQSVKGLQLQRLDLVIAGTPEEDAAIKALDAQIAALQQQSERLSLVESLQLDPLKRKLEETFTPVKELGFDEIIKQFDAIQKQKAPLTDAIAGGENLKAALETTIKDAEARFGEAGKQVTIGFANGIKATTPQVTAAGKASGQAALSGVNQVMAFGSPSRTMIQRGEWVTQGFVVGINAGNKDVQQAGVTTMWSFLTGMRNVYENRVKPFVISIAEWIRENKGPVAYDATLLRPAGEAMMYGFKRGLTDGFGEIQSWVRQVGPSLANDSFPNDLFIKRSARFLINNARMDSDFDPQDAFGDLVFDAMGIVGGDIPQSLAFLHKTLSSADTLDMAQKLGRMFDVGITDFLRPPGTKTLSGYVSDHTFGTAVDMSNGSRPTPQMDALYAAIEPLLGKVFKQILYRTNVGGDHFDHVHAAWLKGDGFSMNSGKKGGLSFPGASDIVNAAMAEASAKTGVNPMLIAAIAKAESGFDPRAGSPAGAQGLMQLMPATARGLGVTNIFDPFQNALGGSKYIKGLLDKYGSIRLALAGYNAGPGNVAKYGGVPPFSETMAYIERVMRYFKNFSTGNFRAQGGKVNALTPYVVGERGQEMFIPSTNGSVVSNRDLRGLISALQNQPAGNSGSTVYDQRQNHIYSNSNDPATVAALVDSRMRSQIVGVRR